MIDPINSLSQAQVPAGGSGLSGGASATEQRDQFLQLLTYQLKAQNPLKPYDNQEFASQLAQFSQLEQLTEMKGLIEEQGKVNLALSRTMTNSALPGMLGKSAKAETNHFRFDGDNKPSLGYALPVTASSGNIEIYDESGNIVRNIEISDRTRLSAGDNSVNWDGKDDQGRDLKDGTYTFYGDFTDGYGNNFEATTYTDGTIESVRFKNDGTVLIIGGMEVTLDKVRDISN